MNQVEYERLIPKLKEGMMVKISGKCRNNGRVDNLIARIDWLTYIGIGLNKHSHHIFMGSEFLFTPSQIDSVEDVGVNNADYATLLEKDVN